MPRFRNILFVADQPGTEAPGLARAVDLAVRNRAMLTVMDVVEPMVWSADNQARFGADLTNILRDRRLDELAVMSVARHQDAVTIDTRVAIGTPFLEIIRAVLQHGHDLVIKCAEPSPGGGRHASGPNDQHLVRKCPCPVWIDRAERQQPYRKVLAAVDPLEETGDELARRVLDIATSFGAREGAEVHVAHAWRLPGESTLRAGRVRLPRPGLEELLATQRQRHADAFSALLEPYRLSIDDANVHFAKGRAAPVISEIAESLPADLIVIGTVGHTGIKGFFIGNTAEGVIQETDLPVFTLKPRGFRSPVEY